MVNQNKISFKIKRQVKDVFLSDVERTVAIIGRIPVVPCTSNYWGSTVHWFTATTKSRKIMSSNCIYFILDKGLSGLYFTWLWKSHGSDQLEIRANNWICLEVKPLIQCSIFLPLLQTKTPLVSRRKSSSAVRTPSCFVSVYCSCSPCTFE